MKRLKNIFISTILTISLLFGGVVTIYASSNAEDTNASPRLSNCNTATFSFSVVDDKLCISTTYSAKSDVFTHAKLTVSFQKKYMLFFWKTVEIGYIDEEWMGYCYDLYGSFYQEFPATGSGTYRANFYFEIYGTSGTTDVLEKTIECDY